MFGRMRGALAREPISTETTDGWFLRGELIRPEGPPVAAAVLGHAMMVDRRTMDRGGRGLGTTLAERGVAVLSFDVRGHGASDPGAKDGGRWTYDAIVRFDVPAMVAEARRRYPDLPVVVVGHSLIGHAAMISAGLLPGQAPDAIVGLAANLWLPRFEPSLRRRLLKGALLLAWSGVTLPRGWFDPRPVRMGSAAEPWPYVWQFTSSYLRNALRSPDGRDDYIDALGRVDVPVLAISSTGDRLLAHPDAVGRFLEPMPRARVTHRILDARDVSPPPDHMQLVLDERCRPVWIEVAEWIAALAPKGDRPED